MAPETLDSSRGHGFEVDIWALGVILYAMLVGKPPFETDSVQKTYRRIRDCHYAFPEHPKISPAAKALVMALLSREPSQRPSLDSIATHPFLTNGLRPKALPSSALYQCPIFTTVAPTSKENCAPAANAAPAEAAGVPHDPPAGPVSTATVQSAARCPLRPICDAPPPQLRCLSALHAARSEPPALPAGSLHTQQAPPPPPPPLQQQQQQQPQLSIKATEAPIGASARLRAGAPNRAASGQGHEAAATDAPAIHGQAASAPAGSDQRRHAPMRTASSSLEIVRAALARHVAPRPAGMPEPQPQPVEGVPAAVVWVTKWVDYSNKYGLGYQLSNGSVGVLFNDNTRIIADADGVAGEYACRAHGRDLRQPLVMTNYPPELEKKVTLLKYFRTYMDSHLLQPPGSHRTAAAGGAPIAASVYVKWWSRGDQAIAFYLNNSVVQLNFFDHCKLVVAPAADTVVFFNRQRVALTYRMSTTWLGDVADVASRLQLAHAIIEQALAKSTPGSDAAGGGGAPAAAAAAAVAAAAAAGTRL